MIITDFERLQVIYEWSNSYDNSIPSLVESLGFTQHKINTILIQHLNHEHRVVWKEIESTMNYE